MNHVLFHRPERWLLCSAVVAAEVRERWVAPAPKGSLTWFRAQAGLIEDVELSDLARRIKELKQGACGAVNVVVARLGPAELDAVDPLDELGVETRVQSWRDERLEVGESLYAPDLAVAEAWARGKSMPLVRLEGADMGRRVADFAGAMAMYESAARARHGEYFEEIYGPPAWQLADESKPLAPAAPGFEPALGAPGGTGTDLPRTLRWGQSAGVLVTLWPAGDEDAKFTVAIDVALPARERERIDHFELVFDNGRSLVLAPDAGLLIWQPSPTPGRSFAVLKKPMAELLRCLAELDEQGRRNVQLVAHLLGTRANGAEGDDGNEDAESA